MKRQSYLVWAMVALVVVVLIVVGYRLARPPSMTTVLLLRHAERDNGSLNEDGLERADTLAHVARKAGVSAIYTTDTERTRLTVQPLADLLKLDPLIYQVGSREQIRDFVTRVKRDQRGKVVLIVSLNPTVPLIIDALGGDSTSCSIGTAYDEFDDLCVVTTHEPGIVQVVNLQYGKPST